MMSKVRSTWVTRVSRGYATDKRNEVCTRVAAHFEVDKRVAQVFDGVAHRQLLRRLQIRLAARAKIRQRGRVRTEVSV
jgi:hypothetical protein